MKLSIYGSTGFIGSKFIKLYPSHMTIKRENRNPLSNEILYFISSIDNSSIFTDTSIDVESNLSVLCEVLNYCKEKDIIFNFISSWYVYGKLDSLPAKEISLCKPKGFYSITKKCAEDMLISFSETFGIKYRIIRLCNVLGKGDKNISNKKNALLWMINKLKEDEKIELHDNGEHIRDIIHIHDACKAIELICRKGALNEIYNVGLGEPISIRNFINLAKEIIQSRSKIISINSPKFRSESVNKSFWMDVDKIQSLGFNADFSNLDIINDLCN